MDREYTGVLDDGGVVRLVIERDDIFGQIDWFHEPKLDLLFKTNALPSTITLKVGGGAVASVNGIIPIAKKSYLDHERQTFKANTLVLGSSAFLGTEKISGIHFIPTNQMHAVYWIKHRVYGSVDDLANPLSTLDLPGAILGRYQVDAIDSEKLEAARVVEENISIVMDIAFRENMNRQGVQRSEHRRVWIGYRNGKSLDEAIGDVEYVCAFISTMLGFVVAPTELAFEVEEPIARRGEKYRVHSRFRTPAPEMRITDLNTGILSAADDRSSYEAALSSWMSRREDWQQAATFALESFPMNNRLDRVRFLNATSWFEATPDDYMPTSSAITKPDLEAAAALASNLLVERGHVDGAKRVRGLLGLLNTPSLAMRLQSAVTAIRARYGVNILPTSAEQICRIIPSIRGSYAHGNDPLLGDNAGLVLEATILLETMCYLLMIAGLGFDPKLNGGADHLLFGSLQRLQVLASARGDQKIADHT